MVKRMRFKRSLGGKRKYGRKSYKSKSYKPYRKSWKSNFYSTYKRRRFFRKGAPTQSGLPTERYYARPHKIPSKLYVFKAAASSILTTLHAAISDYFINSYFTTSDELVAPPDYHASHGHSDALSALNPMGIFNGDRKDFGLSRTTVDPHIKLNRTKISFSGHNSDLVSIVSLYSPLMISHNSITELNRIFGCEYNIVNLELIGRFGNSIPVVVFDPDHVGTAIAYQIGSYDMLMRPTIYPRDMNNPVGYLTDADIQNYAATVGVLADRRRLIEYWYRVVENVFNPQNRDSMVQLVLFVNCDQALGRPFTYVNCPYVPADHANHVAWATHIDTFVTQYFQNEFPGYQLTHHPRRLTTAMRMFNENPFKRTMICTSSLDNEKLKNFRYLVADIIAYTHYRAAVAMPTDATSTVLGLYIDDCINNRGNANVDYSKIDSCINDRTVSIKRISTNKGISYLPKSQVNAHFVVCTAGVTLKITSYFSRDYSGFMALFKTAVKNEKLRGMLSPQGLELFRKLEPTYNLDKV